MIDSKIKDLLDRLGFSNLWDNQARDLSISAFKTIVSQRLIDVSHQEWHNDVNMNSQCIVYRIFKRTLEFEKYLVQLNATERKIFCRFRCLNNKLPIVTGRYANVPRGERLCEHCSQ